jgi:hypothetical protein
MFSRRERQALAAAIKCAKPDTTEVERTEQWHRQVALICAMLRQEMGYDKNGNRRFKKDRFLIACDSQQD